MPVNTRQQGLRIEKRQSSQTSVYKKYICQQRLWAVKSWSFKALIQQANLYRNLQQLMDSVPSYNEII